MCEGSDCGVAGPNELWLRLHGVAGYRTVHWLTDLSANPIVAVIAIENPTHWPLNSA